MRWRHLASMLRLPYMPVVLGPQYLGFVLAERRLLPETAPDLLVRFLPGMAALGPLLWGGTLLLNDVCDLPGDRLNPRRERSPLVRGEVTAGQVLATALAFKAGALALAALVAPRFLLVLASLALLSWLYSAEPFRLKGRAGGDVLVNALGFGALCTLSGWAVFRPLPGFPWLLLLPLCLGWASLYLPTTLIDLAADRQAGVTTFAVRFGPRVTYRASLLCMVLSILLLYVLALCGYVLSPAIVAWTAPLAALQVFAFVRHAREAERPARVYRGIVLAAVVGLIMEVFVVLYLAGVLVSTG